MNSRTVKKCVEAFKQIEAVQDLKREKITQSEHFEIGCTISDAVQAYNERRSYEGETISQGVSDWFMKRGAHVEPCGIGWQINF